MMLIENCEIVENKKIAHNIWKMTMESDNICANYKGPGQFVSIQVKNQWDVVLRKPMSIAAANESRFTIIYKVYGKGTIELSRKSNGEILNVLGPIGNVFTKWENSVTPVLVGGGIGLAPIINIHSKCLKYNIDSALILGARAANEHFYKHAPKANIYLTTENGSIGIAGTVMSALDQILSNISNPFIYSCGPEPMLRAIQVLCKERNIPGQVSVESYMACSTGLCQGCVIRRNIDSSENTNSYNKDYSLVCIDGPVYDVNEVTFD
ncbi:dihydroorotate dehydrogenase electron transfer subunit [Candidatus Neomarinimicrobiota bacterium]